MARKSVTLQSPHSAEEMARVAYVKAMNHYDELWKQYMAHPDKIEAELGHKVDVAQRVMFRAFDQWAYFLSHTITVDEDEIRQLIVDALDANQEAMPQNILDLPPLDRHRAFKQLAADIVEELKNSKVHVFEEGMNAPLCEECAA